MICESQHFAPSVLYNFRSAFVLFLLVISFLMFHYLSYRLISQVYYHKASHNINRKHFIQAAAQLEKATHFNSDDFKILNALGDVYFSLSTIANKSTAKNPSAKRTFDLTRKAKIFYSKAFGINKLDAETAYALARTETRLEALYPLLHPSNKKKENPYQPLKYYKQAVRLNPSGIAYNYAMARYLFHTGNIDELVSTIRDLAYIYPPSYDQLKKEKLWAPNTKQAFKQGLLDAVMTNPSLKSAHIRLSSILADEHELLPAISHYETALTIHPFENTAGDYINLGRLYLKHFQTEKAEKNFTTALDMSPSVEKDLEKIYGYYKAEGMSQRFYLFFKRTHARFPYSFEMEITKARLLLQMQRFREAEKLLTDLNQKEQTAEAYFWLYRIAEIEKDADKMELAIQKASMLERTNSKYHLLFSRILKRLKKMEGAEKEAGLAIKYAVKSKAYQYDYRAKIRWDLKYYKGAAEDWQKAASLNPDRAVYYAQTAKAFEKLGDYSQAAAYYKDALERDPENIRYKKKYAELKAM